MKRIVSIVLILVMSLQCFYELGMIAYFHMNREYIAEVLCINKEKPITMCYGSCFLEKNFDIGDDTDNGEGTFPAGKQRIDFPVFMIAESVYSFHDVLKFERPNSPYMASASSEHQSAPFRPPAIVS